MKNTILLFSFLFTALSASAQTPIVIAELDSCNFESHCDMVVLDSTTAGIWQIGQPHKIIFDSAYSPVNVIITDTVNNYPINQNCFFEVLVQSDHGNDNLRLTFHHRFNTDTLIDGGYIEVSYDDGVTWENIINYTTPFGQYLQNENLYSYNDTLKGGINGFSGNSNGWITSSIVWITPGVKATSYTRKLRFHFISDSIETNKEGWMIDDIKLQLLQQEGGIKEVNNSSFKIYPNPANDFLSLDFKEQSLKPKIITIYNLMGQVVKTISTSNSQKEKIDISELNKGFYILKVFENDKYLGSCKWLKT